MLSFSSSTLVDALCFGRFEHDSGHNIEGHKKSNGNEKVKLLFLFKAIMHINCWLKKKIIGGLNQEMVTSGLVWVGAYACCDTSPSDSLEPPSLKFLIR